MGIVWPRMGLMRISKHAETKVGEHYQGLGLLNVKDL